MPLEEVPEAHWVTDWYVATYLNDDLVNVQAFSKLRGPGQQITSRSRRGFRIFRHPTDITHFGYTPTYLPWLRIWGLCLVDEALGLDHAAGGDEVFRDLVLARIIEPTSKVDSLRVLAETGIDSVTYRTLTRRLPGYAKASFRAALSAACTGHAGLGPASLVLYDVTTLYFETDAGDRVPRIRVFQGTQTRTADHRRAAHRCHRLPTGSGGVQRQRARDRHDAAGHRRLQNSPPAHRCDRGG